MADNEKNKWELSEGKKKEIVGVVNPKVLKKERRNLRIFFLRLIAYDSVRKKLIANSDVNTYAVLGDFDIICESFDEETYSLREALEEWGIYPFVEGSATFSTRETFWYYGQDMEEEVEDTAVIISKKEKQSINKLVENWNDSAVAEKERKEIVKREIIFPVAKPPPFITVFICIGLPGVLANEAVGGFRRILQNELREYKRNVIGLYKGFGVPMPFQYILKIIVDDFREIHDAVNKIHGIQGKYGYRVITRTYPVMETLHEELIKLGRSKIEEKKVRSLTRGFRKDVGKSLEKTLSNLAPTEIGKLVKYPKEKKLEVLEELLLIDGVWKEFPIQKIDDERARTLIEKSEVIITRAIVSNKLVEFSHAFLLLSQAVEIMFRSLIYRKSMEVFASMGEAQNKLGLRDKDTRKLSFSETLGAIVRWNQLYTNNPIVSEKLLDDIKYSNFVYIRNLLSHGRLDEIQPVKIVRCYSTVLSSLADYLKQ